MLQHEHCLPIGDRGTGADEVLANFMNRGLNSFIASAPFFIVRLLLVGVPNPAFS
jgi:hypothetical protein